MDTNVRRGGGTKLSCCRNNPNNPDNPTAVSPRTKDGGKRGLGQGGLAEEELLNILVPDEGVLFLSVGVGPRFPVGRPQRQCPLVQGVAGVVAYRDHERQELVGEGIQSETSDLTE